MDKCPIDSKEDFILLSLLVSHAKIDSRVIAKLCQSYATPESLAISRFFEYPLIDKNGFKLFLNRFAIHNEEILKYFSSKKTKTKKLIIEKAKVNKLSEDGVYHFYQDYLKKYRDLNRSELSSRLLDVFFSLISRNQLRLSNDVELIGNMDLRRISFEYIINKSSFYTIVEFLDDVKEIQIDEIIKNIFLNLLFQIDNDESNPNLEVFESTIGLREQLNSYLGRSLPLYYFQNIKKQITQKELRQFAENILLRVKEGRNYNLETLIFLANYFPRDKKLLQKIIDRVELVKDESVHYQYFAILDLVENDIFRRMLSEKFNWLGTAEFQIKRNIYIKMLSERKTSLFALIKLWKMGDLNQLHVWKTAINLAN